MLLKSMVDDVIYLPRAERVSFDIQVRFRHRGQRSTVLLKNLTTGGARVEGLPDIRCGDKVTLYLPSLKPKDAHVVWTVGSSVGLEFERPLHPDIFEELVLRHAQKRERTETDRMLQVDGRSAPSWHEPAAYAA